MTPRRRFLKTVSVSALASELLSSPAQAQQPAMPAAGDPAYWDRVRDQFLLARDKTFFNNGTIGAMPRVVMDRTVAHLRKLAVDVADWDYRSSPNWIGG
jgi:isopenicillin-N epimerase